MRACDAESWKRDGSDDDVTICSGCGRRRVCRSCRNALDQASGQWRTTWFCDDCPLTEQRTSMSTETDRVLRTSSPASTRESRSVGCSCTTQRKDKKVKRFTTCSACGLVRKCRIGRKSGAARCPDCRARRKAERKRRARRGKSLRYGPSMLSLAWTEGRPSELAAALPPWSIRRF